MSRMSRELTLVLLGSGLLTAGYFAWPEADGVEAANAANQAEADRTYRSHGGAIIFFSPFSSRPAAGPGAGAAAAPRGGFGRIGSFMSGGGGS
jgi:hypothetical protein